MLVLLLFAGIWFLLKFGFSFLLFLFLIKISGCFGLIFHLFFLHLFIAIIEKCINEAIIIIALTILLLFFFFNFHRLMLLFFGFLCFFRWLCLFRSILSLGLFWFFLLICLFFFILLFLLLFYLLSILFLLLFLFGTLLGWSNFLRLLHVLLLLIFGFEYNFFFKHDLFFNIFNHLLMLLWFLMISQLILTLKSFFTNFAIKSLILCVIAFLMSMMVMMMMI